ncbi:MAG: PAS domain S-box protein [Pseudodesulfovibrio sp.]
MTRHAKSFIQFFGPLALGIVVIAAWFVHSRTGLHRETIAGRQSSVVAQASRLVTHNVVSRLADIRFLTRVVVRTMEVHHKEAGLDELENAFTDFSASRPAYFQVRLLADDGQELIRIEQDLNGPERVPRPALQNKAHRYYFQKAQLGGPEEVYVSELDLNIEHGKLESPLRPTLRMASPVIAHDGRQLGVVVLNLDATALLAQVTQLASTREAATLFCNAQGYWFIAPGSEDAWGHLLDRGNARMPTRFPEAWKAMAGKSSGQVLTDQGLFTFGTIGVTPDEMVPRGIDITDPGDRGWRIVTRVPPAELALPWRNLFVLLTACGLLILAAGLWHFLHFRFREYEAELRVRETEERTLAITRTSRDAIVMVDGADRITYWNPAAESMFGYAREDVLDRELHAFLTPVPLDRMGADPGGASTRVTEFEAAHKDKTPIPVELSSSRFKHGGQWYTVGFMRDITRRKQREAALRRSEETARALLNAPTESAMLISPSGTIVAINETGAQRLGGDTLNVVGKSLFQCIGDGVAETYREVIHQVFTTGEATQFESLRKGRRFLVNVYPVMGANRDVDTIALFGRDVTEQYEAQAALRHSEQRFRDVSEAVGEFIWETDAKCAFTFITDDIALVVGYTREELLGQSMGVLIPEAFQADFQAWRSQVMNGLQPFSNVEMQSQTRDGQLIWLRMSGVPYFDDAHVFLGYRGAAMNITQSKQQQEAIKASERKLRALAESAYDAIVMIDNLGHVSFWNHAAEKLFGYTEEEALGRDVHELISPRDRDMGDETALPPLSMTGKGSAVGDIREAEGVDKKGRHIPLELSVAGFRLGDRWFAVATIRDITERRATEIKLRELATTDALTGLNNRRWFMELAQTEFSRSRRYNRSLAMFMMDIDHFKLVNDTHGHDVGDQVLSALAGIAVGALREADLLGRLGGEEFGVLLPETSRQAAMDVAERLRLAVEDAVIHTNAGDLRITVSIGVAIMGGATGTVDALLKDADVALYEAKQSGRNRVAAN